jgi:predicted enzyme related to lactoylglutathione lyase
MTTPGSTPAAGAKKLLNGLVQVALGASDPARTVAFYRDVLGLNLTF